MIACTRVHAFVFGRIYDFLTRYSLVRATRLTVTAALDITANCGLYSSILTNIADIQRGWGGVGGGRVF